MGKRIKDYISKMIKVSDEMATGKLKQNKSEVLSEMLVQISFFQHERLIHLIVTVLFAFLTIFTAACSCFSSSRSCRGTRRARGSSGSRWGSGWACSR